MTASPDKPTVTRRVQLCGKNWSHPAISNGLFYVRDGRELAAYKIANEPVPK